MHMRTVLFMFRKMDSEKNVSVFNFVIWVHFLPFRFGRTDVRKLQGRASSICLFSFRFFALVRSIVLLWHIRFSCRLHANHSLGGLFSLKIALQNLVSHDPRPRKGVFLFFCVSLLVGGFCSN
jgi:hypothetical protein